MAGRYRSFFKRLMIILNSLTAVVFGITCLSPYLHPQKWWVVSLMSLGFAFLLILLLLFLLFWLFIRRRYVLISLIAILIGWKSVSVFFAFHLPREFNYRKSSNTIRIVDWNVARFLELKRNNNAGSQTRLKMLDLIKAQNADVLCLQEFFHSTDTTLYDNISYVQEKLGFPFYYYSWDGDGDKQWFGQMIFSKYPIIDSGKISFPKPGLEETLIHADILFKGDTVRFYTTHLQSVQFKKNDYESIEEIKKRKETIVENSRGIFSKLKRALIIRSTQADMVKEIIHKTPHPYVMTGDFNDVPNSYTYNTIRGPLQDAFLRKEFGIGRTYSGLSPTLRIDYILPSKHFSVIQFDRIERNYSDHYMLVSDLRLKTVSGK
jgi:endonuclease/exonuclease/phosphatase family metal-dependent hydrolase